MVLPAKKTGISLTLDAIYCNLTACFMVVT